MRWREAAMVLRGWVIHTVVLATLAALPFLILLGWV